jgi:monovalent cation/hydrogen antiporter
MARSFGTDSPIPVAARDLLRAQRATLIRLRNEGRIGDEVMHRIEHDLDLEESRLEM